MKKAKSLNKIKYVTVRPTAVITLVIYITAMLCLSGCKAETESRGTGAEVFYLSASETKLEPRGSGFELTGEKEKDIESLLGSLSSAPDDIRYRAPLAKGFSLLGYTVSDSMLTLDFDAAYTKMDASTEVLVRAAIVKTLLGVKGIRYIYFTVEGEPLTDNIGKPVGGMSSKTFIYNDGNAINTYDEVVVKLYFANKDATGLIGAYRDKFYSTNVPLELFVVEETIAGPSGQIEGLYPTINPDTNIIGVSTSDGVCYVNLDAGFTVTVGNVPTEMAAYSIVNALTDLPGIERVQILVNGEVPSVLSAVSFEKNDDIVTTLETGSDEENTTESSE